MVASYMGAWIETLIGGLMGKKSQSHPTWVRGLKHITICSFDVLFESHPTWVRGLKLC